MENGTINSSATDQAMAKTAEAKAVAQEKAGHLAEQAREMFRERMSQQSTVATEKLSSTVEVAHTVGDELRRQGKDQPAQLADKAAEQVELIANYLSESTPEQILDDIERMTRRRPWAVAAGGLAIGFLGARFLKGSSRQRYESASRSSMQDHIYPSGETYDLDRAYAPNHVYASEAPTETVYSTTGGRRSNQEF